jgi:biopolymer transport protein ExbD
MLRKRRPSPKLFSNFNTLQFASVMGMVAVVVLSAFMTATPMITRGVGPDLPNAYHAVSMPGALREDVMLVSITRDGAVYFGGDRVWEVADLSGKIQDRLKNHGVERKVYINADMRTRWGGVKQVLGAVHSAGILRVAFLVNQRHS